MIDFRFKEVNRKLLLSAFFGILGLVLSPFGMNIEIGVVHIDIPWSMAFPIISAMAYGYRYGLIAGISGGALFPFLLWPNNGWANLFTSLVYMGTYALLGLLYERKFLKIAMPFSVKALLAFGIYGSVITLYELFLFNPILSLNPPFWIDKTIQELPQKILLEFAIKDIFNILLLTFFAETLLQLNIIRRFLGQPVEKQIVSNSKILTSSVFITLIVWVAFVGLDYILLGNNRNFIFEHLSQALLAVIVSGFIISRILFYYNRKEYAIESALIKSEEKYRTLVQYSSDPIFSFNPDETYRFVNEAFARAFGKKADEIIGKTPHAIFPFDEAEKRLTLVRNVFKTGEKGEIEVKVNTHSGAIRYLITLVDPIKNENGEVLFVTCISKDITERKLAEEALKQTEERYRIFISQVTEGVYRFELDKPMPIEMPVEEQIDYLYDHMRIAECNKAFIEMYGTNQNNIIGKTQRELHGEDDNHINRNALRQFIATGYKVDNVETKEIDSEGRVKYFINNAIGIVENGHLIRTWGTQTDITTQKEIELELIKAKKADEDLLNQTLIQNSEIELQNERLESLLRISHYKSKSKQDLLDFALKEAIELTASKIGYIYFYNETTQLFTLNTWSKEVMKECSVLNPQSVYELEKTGCWGEAVRQRRPIIINDYATENSIKKGTPDGHVKLKKFLTIPVIIDNAIVAVVGVANKIADYDQSDIRQLALLMDSVWKISERENMIENLKTAKEKAEEGERLKTAFLANMSHEIRTPMNGILGFTEILKEPNLSNEKRQKYISIIEKSGERLLNIINDVINISKVDSGQMKVTLTATNVNEQIDFINNFFKPEIEVKGLQLAIRKNLPNPESIIVTDTEKLYAILTNLVKNAIKFTSKGSIEVGYEKKEGFIEFFVKDTGDGISDEQKGIIFERFRQGSESLSRSYEGAGLGLSISKAYVEMLGGKIWVDSQLGEGSTFYFTIPYEPYVSNDSKAEGLHLHKTDKKLPANITILLAEDDESSRIFISEIIERQGNSILYAKNGLEAVNVCLSNPNMDVVLMDINMPEMGGYEAVQRIREFNKEVIIIAQTAYALSEDKERIMSSGFNDYISKPINKTELLATIVRHLNHKA